MDRLTQGLKKLTIDWGSLVAVIGLAIGAFWFLANIDETNKAQGQSIASLSEDVNALKKVLPEVQRSLGRIEGHLGTNYH